MLARSLNIQRFCRAHAILPSTRVRSQVEGGGGGVRWVSLPIFRMRFISQRSVMHSLAPDDVLVASAVTFFFHSLGDTHTHTRRRRRRWSHPLPDFLRRLRVNHARSHDLRDMPPWIFAADRSALASRFALAAVVKSLSLIDRERRTTTSQRSFYHRALIPRGDCEKNPVCGTRIYSRPSRNSTSQNCQPPCSKSPLSLSRMIRNVMRFHFSTNPRWLQSGRKRVSSIFFFIFFLFLQNRHGIDGRCISLSVRDLFFSEEPSIIFFLSREDNWFWKGLNFFGILQW